ncbi:hypothetical protein [Bosea sp. (in: a-proteobacteria)]|jgi:hypothetical protein|uniref:hypothetical protein n=1 Tax=Bosea sp. (in: a-proteobacteria) TaxID=1871050 RepID=UPI0035647F57
MAEYEPCQKRRQRHHHAAEHQADPGLGQRAEENRPGMQAGHRHEGGRLRKGGGQRIP